MLTGLWNLKEIQNSRQNCSENKLVNENAVTQAYGSCSLRVLRSWSIAIFRRCGWKTGLLYYHNNTNLSIMSQLPQAVNPPMNPIKNASHGLHIAQIAVIPTKPPSIPVINTATSNFRLRYTKLYITPSKPPPIEPFRVTTADLEASSHFAVEINTPINLAFELFSI